MLVSLVREQKVRGSCCDIHGSMPKVCAHAEQPEASKDSQPPLLLEVLGKALYLDSDRSCNYFSQSRIRRYDVESRGKSFLL